MRKKIVALFILSFVLMLSACGKKQEFPIGAKVLEESKDKNYELEKTTVVEIKEKVFVSFYDGIWRYTDKYEYGDAVKSVIPADKTKLSTLGVFEDFKLVKYKRYKTENEKKVLVDEVYKMEVIPETSTIEVMYK